MGILGFWGYAGTVSFPFPSPLCKVTASSSCFARRRTIHSSVAVPSRKQRALECFVHVFFKSSSCLRGASSSCMSYTLAVRTVQWANNRYPGAPGTSTGQTIVQHCLAVEQLSSLDSETYQDRTRCRVFAVRIVPCCICPASHPPPSHAGTPSLCLEPCSPSLFVYSLGSSISPLLRTAFNAASTITILNGNTR